MSDNEKINMRYIEEKCRNLTRIQRAQLEEYSQYTNTKPLAQLIAEILEVKND